MKPLILITSLLVTFFVSFSAFSFESCEGVSQKFLSRAEQKGNDVLVTLANESFRNYRNVGEWKISGKEISTILIHDLDIDSFMKNQNKAVDVFVSLVLGRRDFDGEYDMAWSYAEDFFKALKCQ